jgi:CHAD domain-containing protein
MTTSSDPTEGGRTGSDPLDSAELVHEARKAIKRIRALARLLRYELGEQEFARVNATLRDAGRHLAGARDAQVRLATLDRLSTRHPRALALGGIAGLRERLERERDDTGKPISPQDALEDIASIRRDLARWNLVDHDFETAAPGLRRVYREGRRRYARVQRESARDAEDVHDWRKRVKCLYYALDMLGGAKSKGARATTRRAEGLGDLLGEEHDLWLLCTYVEQHADALGEDTAARAALLKLVGRRRTRLRKRALELGARLYERKPGDFVRHIGDSLTR